MAKFYGTVQGCRGEATRLGTSNSGMRASVQSYDGSIITRVENVDGENIFSIDTSDDSRSSWGNRKFRGTLEQFNEMMDLVNKIGKTEVINLLKNYKN